MSVRESSIYYCVLLSKCLVLSTEPAWLASVLHSLTIKPTLSWFLLPCLFLQYFDSMSESPAKPAEFELGQNEEEEGCGSALQILNKFFSIMGLPLQSVTNKMLFTNSSSEKCAVKSIIYCLSVWGKYLFCEEGETFSS